MSRKGVVMPRKGARHWKEKLLTCEESLGNAIERLAKMVGSRDALKAEAGTLQLRIEELSKKLEDSHANRDQIKGDLEQQKTINNQLRDEVGKSMVSGRLVARVAAVLATFHLSGKGPYIALAEFRCLAKEMGYDSADLMKPTEEAFRIAEDELHRQLFADKPEGEERLLQSIADGDLFPELDELLLDMLLAVIRRISGIVK